MLWVTLKRTSGFNLAAVALSLATVGASSALGDCRLATHRGNQASTSGSMSASDCRNFCDGALHGWAPAICSHASPGSSDFRQIHVYQNPDACVTGLTRSVDQFPSLGEDIERAVYGNANVKGLPEWAIINGCFSGQDAQHIWRLEVRLSSADKEIVLARVPVAPRKLRKTVEADRQLLNINPVHVQNCRAKLMGYNVEPACPDDVLELVRYSTGPKIAGWGMPQIFQEAGNLSFRLYQIQLLSELAAGEPAMDFSLVEPWSYQQGNQAYGTSGAYLAGQRRRPGENGLMLVPRW